MTVASSLISIAALRVGRRRRCRYKRSMQLKAAAVRTWVVLGCIAAARALLGVVAAARRARRVRGGPVL
jgi:hypothetical protein